MDPAKRGSSAAGDLTLVLGPEATSRPLSLPYPTGSPTEALIRELLHRAAGRAAVVTLRPPTGLTPQRTADWHEDAWWALDPAVRDRLVLIAGPTADVLVRSTKRVRRALVVAPPSPVPGFGPKRLARLTDSHTRAIAELTAIANPHARLVWAREDPIPFSYGEPEPTRRWHRWADRIAERRTLVHADELPAVAEEIGSSLGLDEQERAAAATAAGIPVPPAPMDDAHRDAMARLHWLDSLLLARAGGIEPLTARTRRRLPQVPADVRQNDDTPVVDRSI